MNNREQQSVKTGHAALNDIQEDYDLFLMAVKEKGEELKSLVESQQYTAQEIVKLISKHSRDLYHLHGVTVAYEPYAFDKSIKLFSPFYDKRRGMVRQLESKYDYTIDSIETNQWYYGPINNPKGFWTEPYLGTDAQMVVADYGIPFYLNGSTKPSGVISLTMDLKKLGSKMDSLAIGNAGTGMIISKTGRVVAHPFPEYVLDLNLPAVAKEFKIEDQVDRIMKEDRGFVTFKKQAGQQAYAFFSKIDEVDWKVILIFNSDDLLGSADKLHKKMVKIFLSGSLLVFFLLLLFIRIGTDTDKKLWFVSSTLAIVIVINILVMWYLNLNFNYSNTSKKEVLVDSRTGLESFILIENTKLKHLGLQKFIPVPTGIFIEEFEFRDSYNVSLRGEVWQKWPIHLDQFYEAGLRFPQEALTGKTSIELVSVERDKKFVTHTWAFRIILKMPFDYSKYPFDVRDIKLELMYPDVKSGILLVPDVDGYSDLSSYSAPGINKNIYFNDSQLLSTQFSFDIVNFHDRFGHKKFGGLNSYPIMKYTINLKRRLLNVMVTNIIPILVVASMIFLIFYSNTKSEEDKSGVSMMGVIQSCAGFFFVLLVAHIDLRRRLNTPELTYIESFYLTMYLMMALLAINVVTFTKTERYKFLNYNDNLLIKVAYWPLLLFSWMIITLVVFYT
jgi:hypothetical protein